VAINYGGSRGVVVYYGANYGMLRANNGNQTGSEMWAFVAPEHLSPLRRKRENDPEVRYPSKPSAKVTARARAREYFFDGPIGARQNTTVGGAVVAQPDR
jgi:type IV pilus assembly protein PilY1